jgi:hypothetical protein
MSLSWQAFISVAVHPASATLAGTCVNGVFLIGATIAGFRFDELVELPDASLNLLATTDEFSDPDIFWGCWAISHKSQNVACIFELCQRAKQVACIFEKAVGRGRVSEHPFVCLERDHSRRRATTEMISQTSVFSDQRGPAPAPKVLNSELKHLY